MKTFAEKIIDSMVDENGHCGELADEFGVHPSIVRSLYDVMPNELYDGIVTALEDMTDDQDYEELFDE